MRWFTFVNTNLIIAFKMHLICCITLVLNWKQQYTIYKLWLLHCPNFQNKRLKLFSKDKMKKMITRILSYSYLSIDDVIKMYIITRVTEYILATKVSLLIKGRSFDLIWFFSTPRYVRIYRYLVIAVFWLMLCENL